jgi:hypothetical protein
MRRETPSFESNYQTVELVNPRYLGDEEENEKRKQERVNNAVEMMKEIEEQVDEEALRNLQAKKKMLEGQRQLERKLRKEFESHAYLSFEAIQDVSTHIKNFEFVSKNERYPKESANFAKVRHENRRQLTKVMLLAIH